MAKLPRVNVGIMAAGQGGAVSDVFAAAVTFLKKRDEARDKRDKLRARRREAEAAAAAADAAGEAARGRNYTRGRVEERNVDDMTERWQRATGWAWDPSELLRRGSSVPLNRALVPVLADGVSRRRLSQEALDAAHEAGLEL